MVVISVLIVLIGVEEKEHLKIEVDFNDQVIVEVFVVVENNLIEEKVVIVRDYVFPCDVDVDFGF